MPSLIVREIEINLQAAGFSINDLFLFVEEVKRRTENIV